MSSSDSSTSSSITTSLGLPTGFSCRKLEQLWAHAWHPIMQTYLWGTWKMKSSKITHWNRSAGTDTSMIFFSFGHMEGRNWISFYTMQTVTDTDDIWSDRREHQHQTSSILRCTCNIYRWNFAHWPLHKTDGQISVLEFQELSSVPPKVESTVCSGVADS